MFVRLISALALYVALGEAATVRITNLITFAGRDYAVADNTPPSTDPVGGCDLNRYQLTDGWGVAADNEESKAVLITTRYPFKYICKVTASGQGYAFGFHDPNCTSDMLEIDTEAGHQEFGVKAGKCGVLMLSRVSTSTNNTWPQQVNITHTLEVGEGHQYATLDDTPPSQIYSAELCGNQACCQNFGMKMNMGWELATSTMTGFTEAAGQPWGTFCTNGRSFLGQECISNITTTSEYAAVRFCDQRVLIKRTPIDCVSSWTEWSACSTGCPSVRSRTRVNITQPAQFGGICTMTETSQSDCPQSCTTVPTTTTVMPTTTTSTTTTTTRNASGATIPSLLAVFAVVFCAIMF